MAGINFEKIVYDIESHPVVTAIAAFLVFFVGYNIFKKPAATAAPVSTTPALPTVYETYNQSYNTYPTTPGGIPVPTPTPSKPPQPPQPVPHPQPPPQQEIWVNATKWPAMGSSLWTIAQMHGISLQQIEALNPQIPNKDLIYPGQRIRVR